MMYQHCDYSGQPIDLPVGKVVCVGRNYLDHIEELNNEVPTEALLFLKPSTAITSLAQPISIPQGLGECHNELEVAILIDKKLTKATASEAVSAIWGAGLALDLTLRDVQSKLKSKGQPWERAKAFDGSCPTSQFVAFDKLPPLDALQFVLEINGELRQTGNSALMIRDIVSLIVDITQVFTLEPGDIVLTGTPSGVGPLHKGDQLQATFTPYFSISTQVT